MTMGQLQPRRSAARVGRRARQPDEKAERRRAILAAAQARFAVTPYHEVRTSDVARDAGLAKGTLFLYFPTKEALFLALLDEALGAWLAALEERLARARPAGLGPEKLAGVLAELVLMHVGLVRLLGLLSTVLEQPLEAQVVVGFKRGLVARLEPAGRLLEERARLRPGEGTRLLLRVCALVMGLRQLAQPGPAAQAALLLPELRPLAIDLNRELPYLLHALLLGLAELPPSS